MLNFVTLYIMIAVIVLDYVKLHYWIKQNYL